MTSDGLGPRSVLGALDVALWEHPGDWPVLLIPAPWFVISGIFQATMGGADAVTALGLSLAALIAYLLTMIFLVRLLLPVVRRKVALRSVSVLLAGYALGGVAPAGVMAAGMSSAEPMVVRWFWLSLSWGLGSAIWLASAALLVSWWHRMRQQRIQLENEYERQVLARERDAQALAKAERQLDAVRSSTHQALAEIRSRLNPRLSAAGLGACVEVIDQVVAGLVRPVSHDLAKMPTAPDPQPVGQLWQGWRKILPALIRTWPATRPFQPALVGLICLPMVLMAEVALDPHQGDPRKLLAVGVLGLHVALLWVAKQLLSTRLRLLPPRVGVAVVFAVYLLLFFGGLIAMVAAHRFGFPAALEAFLVPPLLAMVAGGVSATAKVRNDEWVAAQAMIRSTNWELRHTRQKLWAERRRLAMALHGRVQANLTAASLMLGLERDRMLDGAPLDARVLARVRSTLGLADLIDQVPSAPPKARLESVAAVWEGVLSVSLDLNADAERLLDLSRDLSDACVEVVREILLNMVRHSGATAAEVVIGTDAKLLRIQVAELSLTREPLGKLGDAGMGRALIDSLAVDWAESDGDEGRVTIALLAATSAQASAAEARSRLAEEAATGLSADTIVG